MFGKGISKTGDILDLAVKENIVEKSGAWFAYGGSKIGQGRENAKKIFKRKSGSFRRNRKEVREFYSLIPKEEGAEAQNADSTNTEKSVEGLQPAERNKED